ncbi:hypothetical protein HHI36_022271, partial [Cryptolaemus montrouzieri]
MFSSNSTIDISYTNMNNPVNHMKWHFGEYNKQYLNQQLETALLLPILAIIVVFLSVFLVIVFKRNPAIVLSTV